MKRTRASLLCLGLAALALGGCSFADDGKIPLEGKRISVLALQKDLSPAPELQDAPLALPTPWVNQYWPQPGGYPSHAMGHPALGPKLQKAWTADIGAGGGRRAPLIAPPVVAQGLVFTLDTSGSVSAFTLTSGNRSWRQSVVPRGEEDTGAVGGGLAYAAGKLYVTNGYKFVSAMNAETGSLVWKAGLPSPARSAPTVANDRVYVITLDNRLVVLSAADGSPLWEHAGVSETTNLLGSACVAADQSLVVLPMSSGELYGLRPENGHVVWEDNLSAVRRMGALSSIADIRGLPVVDQGMVFASSYSGRFVALDQVTGRRIWQREIGSAETPWAAGAYVFVITAEQQLVALARANGGIRWFTQLPRHADDDGQDPVVWTGPLLAGGRLVVASSGGRLLEISPDDGKVLHTVKLPGPVTIPPIVADETLLLLTRDGVLAAYRG